LGLQNPTSKIWLIVDADEAQSAVPKHVVKRSGTDEDDGGRPDEMYPKNVVRTTSDDKRALESDGIVLMSETSLVFSWPFVFDRLSFRDVLGSGVGVVLRGRIVTEIGLAKSVRVEAVRHLKRREECMIRTPAG